ncbi:hypothetical protein WMY93_000420 [Mugilogobius chulae]|uniref:Cadherin domain-containing protein n=1 Tax=Mugilogobius chulae TaxID=88201 RepID=A0AAW0Q230_9GOBI
MRLKIIQKMARKVKTQTSFSDASVTICIASAPLGPAPVSHSPPSSLVPPPLPLSGLAAAPSARIKRNELANWANVADPYSTVPFETYCSVKAWEQKVRAVEVKMSSLGCNGVRRMSVGGEVLQSDQDRGDGAVKYVLSGEGAGTIFVLDENNGDLHATRRLDREEKAFYVLRATVVNKRTGLKLEPETEFVIKLHDINDNEPTFSKEVYKGSVPERAEIGTSVIQVTATDADDSMYGNSAKLVYSISQGHPYFSVDPNTGVIRTALGPGDMDREQREHYQVVIEAKDMAGQRGGLTGSTIVNISLTDVNDNPPRFTQNQTDQIERLSACVKDIKTWMSLNYILLDNVSVASSSTVRNLGPLDYERKQSYTVEIQVQNTHVDQRFPVGGSSKDVATVRISVEDVDEPPHFDKAWYQLEVKEDAAAEELWGVYAIDRRTDLDRVFNIHPGNGSIFLLRPIDRENNAWHNISVIASEFNNTAAILTRRNSYSRLQQSVYLVAVVITDADYPMQSSTGTLTVRVCTCDRHGNMELCNAEALSSSPGLSTGALIAILLCAVILLMIVFLFAALKRQRKQEPLIISKEDVRDNVVSYNDEGGAKRTPRPSTWAPSDTPTPPPPWTNPPSRDATSCPPTPCCTRPCADTPPPPCSSRPWARATTTATYGTSSTKESWSTTATPRPSVRLAGHVRLRGGGVRAESLSSLGSASSEADQDYQYLSEWGPRFRKLADLYGAEDDFC